MSSSKKRSDSSTTATVSASGHKSRSSSSRKEKESGKSKKKSSTDAAPTNGESAAHADDDDSSASGEALLQIDAQLIEIEDRRELVDQQVASLKQQLVSKTFFFFSLFLFLNELGGLGALDEQEVARSVAHTSDFEFARNRARRAGPDNRAAERQVASSV